MRSSRSSRLNPTNATVVLAGVLLLTSCDLFGGDEQADPQFCTIEPTEVTVQTGAIVRFTAECSGQIIIDERSDVNASYISRTDQLDWFAPLIPGEFEAVVHLEGDSSVRAVAQVTVLEDPIAHPTPTLWRARRGHHRPAFSPDGSQIAALTHDKGALQIWDAQTLDLVEQYDGFGVAGFGWHHTDPSRMVINGGPGVVDFDFVERHVTRSYAPRYALEYSVYSPDGNHIAAWDDEAILLDEVATDGHTASLFFESAWYWGHAEGLPDLDDDELLVLAIDAPVSDAWFTEDSSELVIAFGGPYYTLAFTYIDVVTGLEVRTVIPGGADCANQDADDCPRGYFVPHPDGERMIGYGQYSGTSQATPPRVFVASWLDGELEYVPDVGVIPGDLREIAVSPDGRYVATQTFTHESGALFDDSPRTGRHMALYDLERLEWVWTQFPEITVDTSPFYTDVHRLVDWVEQDRILMNTTEDPIDDQGVFAYLDPADGSIIQEQALPDGAVERVRWNPDGTRAYWFGLQATKGPNLIVYDSNGTVLWSDSVTGADWIKSEPDQIVTSGDDLMWRDADTGEELRSAELSVEVSSIALNDGQTLVIGWNNGAGGHILQDVETGERLNDMITGAVLTAPYDWTAEGLIVDGDGNAWNPETRENSTLGAPWSMPDVESDVLQACFDSCTTGESVCRTQCQAQAVCFAFSPGGGRVVIGEAGFNFQVPDATPEVLQFRVLDYPTLRERGVFEARKTRESCSMHWHPTRDELLFGSRDLVRNLDITTSLE